MVHGGTSTVAIVELLEEEEVCCDLQVVRYRDNAERWVRHCDILGEEESVGQNSVQDDRVTILRGGAQGGGDKDNGNSVVNTVCRDEKMHIRKSDSTREHHSRTSTTLHQKLPAHQGEGEFEEEFRELSPYVSPYRKGRGPKLRDHERRPSYWDEDIWPPDAVSIGRRGGRGGGRMRNVVERKWKGENEEVPGGEEKENWVPEAGLDGEKIDDDGDDDHVVERMEVER